MSETKLYVVENTESLLYKAKSTEHLFLAQRQTKRESTFEFVNVLNTPVIVRIKRLKSSSWRQCLICKLRGPRTKWGSDQMIRGGRGNGAFAQLVDVDQLNIIANNMPYLNTECLVFFLPWWLYDANCRMDFKDFARSSTASNVYIFYESLSKVPLVFALS